MTSKSFVLELMERSKKYAISHIPPPVVADVPVSDRAHTVIFCCADGRVDPKLLFNLSLTDAVVLRNAGCGMPRNINDFLIFDEILELREVLIISHTDCGLTHFTDSIVHEGLKKRVTGHDEEIDGMYIGTFKNCSERVKSDVKFFKSHPLVRRELAEHTFGAVYDIKTGEVTIVES